MAYATLRRADHFERVEVAYASMEGGYTSWKDAYAHLVRFRLLGFGSSLGLFQIFSQTHYSKFVLIDKILWSLGPGIPDIGRYKMGCLQLPLFWQNRL